jgi:hypothetical protein
MNTHMHYHLKLQNQILTLNFTTAVFSFCNSNVSGELVAHFKFTVLLMPNGPHRITGFDFKPELFDSEFSVEDAEIKVRYLFFLCRLSRNSSCTLEPCLVSARLALLEMVTHRVVLREVK